MHSEKYNRYKSRNKTKNSYENVQRNNFLVFGFNLDAVHSGGLSTSGDRCLSLRLVRCEKRAKINPTTLATETKAKTKMANLEFL